MAPAVAPRRKAMTIEESSRNLRRPALRFVGERASYGGGEDATVVDIDEGVKRSAGEGEKDGGRKGAGDAVFGSGDVGERVEWLAGHGFEYSMKDWMIDWRG
jgi:hypothetical protein